MQRDLVDSFSYCPESGSISDRTGRIVGSKLPNGYVYVTRRQKKYLAHRLAWLLHYGHWPASQIDHINRDRTDNRLANLRLASTVENAQNCGVKSSNRSGAVGVTRRHDGRWYAQIRVDGKRLWLGVHDTLEEAADAYQSAKAQHHAFAPRTELAATVAELNAMKEQAA